MNHSTGNPTRAQQDRFRAIQALGCLPCILLGIWGNPCDIQHVVEGGKRLGHDETYGSCPWHHRGIAPGDWSARQAEESFGPSLAISRRRFAQQFGTERELLAKQDELIAQRRAA